MHYIFSSNNKFLFFVTKNLNNIRLHLIKYERDDLMLRLSFSFDFVFQGIKMLVAVVVLYAILWLPMNVFQLCLNLLCYEGTQYQNFCSHGTLLQLLYIASHFLTVSNTAINPIIYGFANNRFRVENY